MTMNSIEACAELLFCFHRLRQKVGVMTSTGKMGTHGDHCGPLQKAI